MLVDVHAHLFHDRFKNDLDQVIQRARATGLKYIINSGVNHSTNIQVLAQAKKYPDILYTSLGVYPLDAVAIRADFHRLIEPINVDEELAFIKKNKENIIAIGECGLDYSMNDGTEKQQQDVFRQVIELAQHLKKPIVIHSRKAEKDTLDILESAGAKNVVLHCFSPSMKIVKHAADLGYSFSIPAIIVRLHHFQTLVEQTSLQQLLTETDAPYLAPFKEQKSEPAFVQETIKIIAKIKKMEPEEVTKNIFANFQKIFLANEKN